MNKNPIVELQKFVGEYSGQGINHDNQSFSGNLTVESIIGQKGILLSFLAKGGDGSVYHEEKTIISPSIDGEIQMWNLNNNVPGLIPHLLRKADEYQDKVRYVFGYNNSTDQSLFREEIALELFSNGEVGYHYSWGMPQGDFQERSGLVMKPVQTSAPDLNHIHLAVKDLGKSKEFYSQMLGFQERTTHGKCLFMTNREGFDLAIDPSIEPIELPSWFHIGIKLKSQNDIEQLYQKFEKNKDYLSKEIERYDDFIFFHAQDPDGYKIEVYWE